MESEFPRGMVGITEKGGSVMLFLVRGVGMGGSSQASTPSTTVRTLNMRSTNDSGIVFKPPTG